MAASRTAVANVCLSHIGLGRDGSIDPGCGMDEPTRARIVCGALATLVSSDAGFQTQDLALLLAGTASLSDRFLPGVFGEDAVLEFATPLHLFFHFAPQMPNPDEIWAFIETQGGIDPDADFGAGQVSLANVFPREGKKGGGGWAVTVG